LPRLCRPKAALWRGAQIVENASNRSD
jgi:hypothetical protein